MFQKVLKKVEFPQVQHVDEIVDDDALEHIMNDCDQLIPEWLNVVKGCPAEFLAILFLVFRCF